MTRHDYRFQTRWRVLATPAEVLAILVDVEALPRWCPAVYRHSRLVSPGDENQIGAVADLVARGRLGYTLRCRLTITEAGSDHCAFTSEGDLVGQGAWRVTRHGAAVLITVDWHVRLDRPLLRRSPALLRPLFAANHDWAMAESERALRLEVRRRRAQVADSADSVS